ncbi:hypothetical protein [Pseudophaeobacter flagellatus]|uniref:hypothetical protein n=1 Tax=Pseudophaeobacter flagellatus TaxID=2899119 RepID=UPI001E63570E|nr:hypothetical protein [Pseudophaeobacter flagellatus]MCD9148984.1 hypothetical protein [Pseudophaeobacter flagellatus]
MVALLPQTIMMGNPPSAGHQPSKADLADWMQETESIAAGGGLSYINDSLAGLNLRAGVADGQFALVLNAEAEAGVYERDGGAWLKVADIPAIFLESMAAVQAQGFAQAAQASEDAAQGYAGGANASALLAVSAAEASGNVVFVETYATASEIWAGLPVDTLIEVMIDESRGDVRARYRVDPGALTFIMTLGSLHPDQNLADLQDIEAARNNLELGKYQTVTFGGIQSDGVGEFAKGVTGGGYGLSISRSGDRVDIAPTDLAGGYDISKKMSYNPAVGVWQISGGVSVGGVMSCFGPDFEKISMVRLNSKFIAGLEAAGLVFRVNEDVTPETDSARVEPAGAAAPSPISLMTREMGDARYARRYTSPAQTIVSGGLVTLAHGLGVVPKYVGYRMRCTVAEFGYSVGDNVMVDFNGSNSNNSRTSVAIVDAANVAVRFSSDATYAFAAANKTNGVVTGLTNSNWELIVEAMA